MQSPGGFFRMGVHSIEAHPLFESYSLNEENSHLQKNLFLSAVEDKTVQ